ncbi:glucosyltransferase domain-containing protein [Helicobacter sp. MIT 14-3879]|uniref:glucosyltransferase domain-containing protein n=1 Tax=Helicobacter sp. MIT 14-3879 TaxID=2040649 RepID=UPI000E1FA50E|nr:glucosyltransferase domain-containing protein [Helicobacter sp. MIT 14-3879]RDU65015.1 hypothetical protein CQA44_01510 [Helicobacter sp. MIT 14-3879]
MYQKFINSSFYEVLHSFFKQENFKKFFFISVGIYIIALFALFRGNIYYIDDWNSSISNTSWDHFSRFLMTIILNKIASVFKTTTDLSPLTQIFSVCFISLSAMILLYIIRKRFDTLGILAAIPLGLSPHFLENLSYKYDSLGMGMSLFLAIVPFLFKERGILFFISSIICLLLMYMTYQASNGIYIVLSLYFAISLYFLEDRDLKQSLKFLLNAGLSFVLASVIYKKFIVIPVDNYVSDSMLTLRDLFMGGGFENIKRYVVSLFNDLKKLPYFQLSFVVDIFFIGSFVIKSRRNKILSFFACVIFVSLGFCLSYGIYFVLQKPLFEPRAFIGFGVFVGTICIASVSLLESFKALKIRILHYLSCIIVVIMSYSLIAFATAYGNAITKQNEYIMFRSELLLRDLINIIPKDKKASIILEGSIGLAKPTNHFVGKYGGIGRLIPPIMMNAPTWYWSYAPLRHLKSPYGNFLSQSCKDKPSDSKLVFENVYHSIEAAGDCYVVILRSVDN